MAQTWDYKRLLKWGIGLAGTAMLLHAIGGAFFMASMVRSMHGAEQVPEDFFRPMVPMFLLGGVGSILFIVGLVLIIMGLIEFGRRPRPPTGG